MATLVEIVPYNKSWAANFAVIEHSIRSLLGPRVVAIDHVGSTAIPGMPAKPLIDVDVTVWSLSDIPSASAVLVAAEYEPRGSRYDDDVWAFLKRSSMPQQRI